MTGGNIMGELEVYRQLGTKPNFTEIGRRYGLSRHTVAKYWREGKALEDARRDRPSGFDPFREEIERKAALPGITLKAVHEFLLAAHPGEVPAYTTFVHYARTRGIEPGRPAGAEPHPLFETEPGDLLEFDWKEGMRLADRSGEVFEFNVFSAVLAWSRMHLFRLSFGKTADDLVGCLLDVLLTLGGVPRRCLTDNMSALVVVGADGRRRRVERAWRFARDAGFELVLAKPRTPQTKGKVESANRFANRLLAYEGDFDGEEGLRAAIANVEARSNSEPCASTGAPPAALFMREKDALSPIGNARHLVEAAGDARTATVPASMLVPWRGRLWSVPPRFVGRRATLVGMEGQLRIYVGSELAAVHDASAPGGRAVYDEAHYREAIAGKAYFDGSDIAEAARANLERLSSLGGGAL